MDGVWEGVLLAEAPDLCEPGIFKAIVENINSMLIEDVGWTEQSNHVEEGELVLVDQGRCRERSRQEMQGWSRGAGVEAL